MNLLPVKRLFALSKCSRLAPQSSRDQHVFLRKGLCEAPAPTRARWPRAWGALGGRKGVVSGRCPADPTERTSAGSGSMANASGPRQPRLPPFR